LGGGGGSEKGSQLYEQNLSPMTSVGHLYTQPDMDSDLIGNPDLAKNIATQPLSPANHKL